MEYFVSKNPLVKEIIKGNADKDLIELLLTKQLPFTEEDYLETFIYLTKIEKIKKYVHKQLAGIPMWIKSRYVEYRQLNYKVAYYILLEGLSTENQDIISNIVQNPMLSDHFLKRIALKGTADMLEILLVNQIKLIATPEILGDIKKNPQANNFIRGKVKELEEFYLEEEEKAKIALENYEKSQEALKNAELAEVETNEEMEGAEEDKLVPANKQLRFMSVPAKIKLAIKGTARDRLMLVKDPNKLVSKAVLESPKLAEEEVKVIVDNKSTPQEIISTIAQRKDWTKNYQILLSLVYNPKTPIRPAIGFINKLHSRDLKKITRDKNIHPTFRKIASRIQLEKK